MTKQTSVAALPMGICGGALLQLHWKDFHCHPTSQLQVLFQQSKRVCNKQCLSSCCQQAEAQFTLPHGKNQAGCDLAYVL